MHARVHGADASLNASQHVVGRTDTHYGCRLLRRNLDSLNGYVAGALAAYNAGLGRVRSVLARLPADATDAQRQAAVDSVTTGRDYSTDVLRRHAEFAA